MRIPLFKIYSDEEDEKIVKKVIRRGFDWSIGKEVDEFEKSLAKYLGVKYCILFNSGTSAGHAAALSLNLKKNSEIIIPSFSFIATANWPLMINSKPRFADIELECLGLNPKSVEKSINRKTKAVIPIHYGGLPCKIFDIKEITDRKKLILIEDASESLGSKIKNVKIGSIGDISIFSFAPNKIITTGEGGAVCTDSSTKYKKLLLLRSHGRKQQNNYFSDISKSEYITIGYNWRMSNIAAALGIAQLSKIDKLISLRKKNAGFLTKHLSQIQGITTPNIPKNYSHVFQMYSIRLKNSRIRNLLQKFLFKKGIMTKIYFEPIHKTKFFRKLGYNTSLVNTNTVSDQILSIPIYPNLTKEELCYIAETIKEFAEKTISNN